MTTVSVVVPSLRGGGRLIELVRRLHDPTRLSVEVLIADNGLPPGTVAEAQEAGASVVPMGENVGFGRAVNRTTEVAAGDILVVVNDDIAPRPRFLERLVGEAVNGGAEMTAGALVREERPDLIESAGIEIDAILSPYDYLQNEPVARLDDSPPPPLGPCGGAAAYVREAFVEVGGFDEGFFAYCEDVDLAIRVHQAGGRCALAGQAQALHAASSTLGYHSVAKACLVGRSRGYLLRKYGVLDRPGSAARTISLEGLASAVLAVRHRSLAPGRARVRGWRACRVRAPFPPRSTVTVSLVDGMRRRYVRSRRETP